MTTMRPMTTMTTMRPITGNGHRDGDEDGDEDENEGSDEDEDEEKDDLLLWKSVLLRHGLNRVKAAWR